MASVIYASAKELAMSLICGVGTRPTGTLKAALRNTDVVAYNAAHNYYDDISASVVGTPIAIGSPTFTGGVLDGNNATLSSVIGAQSEAIDIYLDTGTPGTSPLIAHIDSGSGLPITPDGNNIAITWNGSGICAL
jgi:hypothetical protein